MKIISFINKIFLKKKKINYTTIDLYTPTKNGMIKSEETLVLFEDGDAIRYYNYSVYPQNNIDNKPLLNAYGQKIYNDIMEVK